MMGAYLIGIVMMLVSWWISSRLKSKFEEYSRISLRNGMSGREVAEQMLRDHGITNVRVTNVPGQLTDHYNPADRTVNLSEAVYHARNAAAAAVAALWSQSRIGIGSALVGVLILLLVNRWPGARDRLAGLVVLIPLIPVVAAWAVVPARALTGVVNGRDLAWIPALEAFIRSPVTGYGPEVLSRAYWRTQPNQWWEPLHAHNQALQTLAESGLIGAAALVALILTAVVATFARSGTMASLLVALLGFLAFQSTVEVPLGLTYFPISYLLPALCLAVFAYTGDLGRATRPVRER